jgi:rabankyrin-5
MNDNSQLKKIFNAPYHFALNLLCSSEEWREEVLTDVTELDWSDLDDAGYALLRWIYTDIVDLQQQDSLSMSLLKAAHKFKLNSLMGKQLGNSKSLKVHHFIN